MNPLSSCSRKQEFMKPRKGIIALRAFNLHRQMEDVVKAATRGISAMTCLLTAFILPTGTASAETSQRLQIPSGQALLLSAEGIGYQIYKSQPKSGSTTEFEWGPATPKATLYANSWKKIAKHYAGPTWEAKDGSKVVGAKIQSVPAPQAGNIPWLLLNAKSHEGEGTFSQVSCIMRVDTVGGVAPAAAPTDDGQEVRVKYRATYIFLEPQQGATGCTP